MNAAAALPSVAGIPLDFILFACTLAVSRCSIITPADRAGRAGRHRAVQAAVLAVRDRRRRAPGCVAHLGARVGDPRQPVRCCWSASRCWPKHFEDSDVPAVLPRFLPDDWKGGFVLLVMVFVLSCFLDNIAAAMIGGAMARTCSAAACTSATSRRSSPRRNAGGAGSVVGDTTTTMMWIAGVAPLEVLEAYIAAVRRAADLRHSGRAPAARVLSRSRSDARGRRAHRLGARRHRRLDPGRGDRRPTSSSTLRFNHVC